jgi:hypothetical protein
LGFGVGFAKAWSASRARRAARSRCVMANFLALSSATICWETRVVASSFASRKCAREISIGFFMEIFLARLRMRRWLVGAASLWGRRDARGRSPYGNKAWYACVSAASVRRLHPRQSSPASVRRRSGSLSQREGFAPSPRP